MRRCVSNSRGSKTRWFAPRRYYSKAFTSIHDEVIGLKSEIELPPNFVEDGGIGNTAERQRNSKEGRGENENTKFQYRKPLPLSPLMDPFYVAAKQKHTQSKAAPSKEPTPFQQQLAKNPYARALATPVRTCALTRIALPSFFLQDFEIIAHPSTKERWWLPRSLTSPFSTSTTDFVISSEIAQPNGVKRGPKAYTLSRAALIKGIATPYSGYSDGEQRFHADTAKQFRSFRGTRIRWREDMDTFILDLMRRRVLEGLTYLSKRQKGYVVGCPNWDNAKAAKQTSAFLWLGPEPRGTVDGDSRAVNPDSEMVAGLKVASVLQADNMVATQQEEMTAQQEQEVPTGEEMEAKCGHSSGLIPGELAIVDLGKEVRSKTPAYNLHLLLGDHYIRELRKNTSPTKVFNSEIVVLKHKNGTIDLQLRLWKLQGYVAEHRQ